MALYRGAVALLYRRSDRKFLLQHRGDDAPRHPGLWACFGGGLEGDETPEQALARELWEEIEYRVHDPRLLLTTERTEGDDTIISYLFFEEYDEMQPIVHQHEGRGREWYTFEEALQLNLSENRRDIFKKIQDFVLALA